MQVLPRKQDVLNGEFCRILLGALVIDNNATVQQIQETLCSQVQYLPESSKVPKPKTDTCHMTHILHLATTAGSRPNHVRGISSSYAYAVNSSGRLQFVPFSIQLYNPFKYPKTVLSSVVVISTSSALVKILMKPGVSSPAKMS